MTIEKLFVLTCGEVDYSSKSLSEKGIRQSEIVSPKIAMASSGKTAYFIFTNDKGPTLETAHIVFDVVNTKARGMRSFYVDDTKMNYLWHLLEAIYQSHCDIAVLVMDASFINQLTSFLCQDNKIAFSAEEHIDKCCGYEVNFIDKKCNSIDWSRAIEGSQTACPY